MIELDNSLNMQFLTALVDQSYTLDPVLSTFILFHNIFILDRSLKWYSIGLLVGISIKYRIGKKLQFLRNFLLTQYAKKANYLPPSDQRPKINLTNMTHWSRILVNLKKFLKTFPSSILSGKKRFHCRKIL